MHLKWPGNGGWLAWSPGLSSLLCPSLWHCYHISCPPRAANLTAFLTREQKLILASEFSVITANKSKTALCRILIPSPFFCDVLLLLQYYSCLSVVGTYTYYWYTHACHHSIISLYALHYALSHWTRICSFNAIYHRKLGLRTICLNFVTNSSFIS